MQTLQLSDVFHPPQSERFIGILSVFLRAALHEQRQRLRETERGRLQVEGTPLAGHDLGIRVTSGKRRGQQISQSPLADVSQGAQDICGAEMNEAVPAQQKIGGRQLVGQDIQSPEGDVFALEYPDMPDQLADDIPAHIGDTGQIDSRHPAKVATGHVEERANPIVAEDARKLGDQPLCLLWIRAPARCGTPPAPDPVPVNQRE